MNNIHRYFSREHRVYEKHPALISSAPACWQGRETTAVAAPSNTPKDRDVVALSRRKAWAQRQAKIHSIDVFARPHCVSLISVIAIERHSSVRRVVGGVLRRRGDERSGLHTTHYTQCCSHDPSMNTLMRFWFIMGDHHIDRNGSSAGKESRPHGERWDRRTAQWIVQATKRRQSSLPENQSASFERRDSSEPLAARQGSRALVASGDTSGIDARFDGADDTWGVHGNDLIHGTSCRVCPNSRG